MHALPLLDDRPAAQSVQALSLVLPMPDDLPAVQSAHTSLPLPEKRPSAMLDSIGKFANFGPAGTPPPDADGESSPGSVAGAETERKESLFPMGLVDDADNPFSKGSANYIAKGFRTQEDIKKEEELRRREVTLEGK